MKMNRKRQSSVCIRYTETDCYITGIVVLNPSILLVCDFGTSSIKIVNTNKNAVESYLTLPGRPRGVTLVGPSRAAVTLPQNKTIQYIKINGKAEHLELVLDELTLEVDGECSGIDFDPDLAMFAVSFTDHPPKLKLLKENGSVHRSLDRENDNTEHFLFERPLCVRFSRNSKDKMVFVLDSDSNTVTIVFVEPFEFVKQKTVDNIKGARGLFVLPDNTILLCGQESNNLCRATQFSRYMEKVVDDADGLEFPCTLAYCEDDNNIYVSCKRIEAGPELWDHLKVFKHVFLFSGLQT